MTKTDQIEFTLSQHDVSCLLTSLEGITHSISPQLQNHLQERLECAAWLRDHVKVELNTVEVTELLAHIAGCDATSDWNERIVGSLRSRSYPESMPECQQLVFPTQEEIH